MNALGKTASYQYDFVGNQLVAIDRNGRTRKFVYDKLNRQVGEQWLDAKGISVSNTAYTYDSIGNLLTASDPNSKYTYVYDTVNRLTSTDNKDTAGVPNVLLNYTYDAADNLLKVTDTIGGQLKGTNSYTYDALNRATSLTQSGNGVSNKRVDISYDATSQTTGLSRFADIAGLIAVASTAYDYDANGRLTNLAHKRNGNNLAAYGYAYDAINRITQTTSIDGTSKFTYDSTNQLTSTDHSFQTDEAYSFDANGNRTNTGYSTGGNNQLLSDGTYSYEYDGEGNRTKRTETSTGKVTEYVWDYRNRLTKVSFKDAAGNEVKTIQYIYDVDNRRIAKIIDADGAGAAAPTTERYVYDGQNIVLSFDGGGTQTHRYFYGTGVDQVLADENAQGRVLWTLTDSQGTVRDLIDSAGVIQNHITYDSFGKITNQTNSSTTTIFGYTGREYDSETEQYYYRARYYDQNIGRFISEDPISFNGGDMNLYRYVGNSPTNYIDPSGLKCECSSTGLSSIGARLRNAAIGAASGAATGAATGAAVGAGVGVFAAGVGALPGAGAGAGAGAIAGGIGGALGGLFASPCADPKDVAIDGAIDGAISGALGGAGAVFSKVRQIQKFSKAGEVLDRNGLTKAGRALQKHGDRSGSVFPKSTGNPSSRSSQGQDILNDILKSNNKSTSNNRFGGKDIFDQNTGRGARYNGNGEFMGFLEP
jgi:RHS repeat-associated protein